MISCRNYICFYHFYQCILSYSPQCHEQRENLKRLVLRCLFISMDFYQYRLVVFTHCGDTTVQTLYKSEALSFKVHQAFLRFRTKRSLRVTFTRHSFTQKLKHNSTRTSGSDANSRQGLGLKIELCCAEMCRFPADSVPSFVIHSVCYQIMCLCVSSRGLFPEEETDYLGLGMRALSKYTFTNYALSLWLGGLWDMKSILTNHNQAMHFDAMFQ